MRIVFCFQAKEWNKGWRSKKKFICHKKLNEYIFLTTIAKKKAKKKNKSKKFDDGMNLWNIKSIFKSHLFVLCVWNSAINLPNYGGTSKWL